MKNERNDDTPLFHALTQHAGAEKASFHTPGHKGRCGFLPLDPRLDLTELPDTDSLFESAGCISRSEAKAAALFGAEYTAVSAGGCTLAIQGMLAAFAGAGSKVIFGRNIHRSAVNTAMLLENGVCARVAVTTFALQKMPRWFVFGDRGTMKLNDFSGVVGGAARIREQVQGFDSVVGQKDLGPSRTMAPLHPDMLEALPIPKEEDMQMEFWDNLLRAARREEEPYVRLEQIYRQMRVVEAAFLSARENRVVETEI